MKQYTLFIALIFMVLISFSCKKETSNEVKNKPYAIVLHGGAGYITPRVFPEEKKKQYELMLQKALEKGCSILENGGNSVDAVQQTISILENSPLFNAGKGSVFDNQGKNKMDASIMDGNTLNTGAVAGVSNIKNPIFLARMVMDSTKHVLLSGKGAEIFAEQHKIEFENDTYFYTKRQHDYLLKVQENERKIALKTSTKKFKKYGTVGAVALDKQGNIAAGTSTGGLTNKKFGRIGDSPIIGAGTYANNKTCGVSCTGTGEFFIRTLAAHEVSSLMQYTNATVKEAAQKVIHENIASLKGKGGLIVLDKKGNIAWNFNTKGMFRAYKKSSGEQKIAFFELEVEK
ncbi:MAG: isoaspartyl peptidase/L-asparaginase [Flavobacteriaceae bacterium]